MAQHSVDGKPYGYALKKTFPLASGDHSALSVLSTLLESSNDMIAAVNTDLCFVVFNTQFRHEFELIYGKKINLGQCMSEVFRERPDDLKNFEYLCRRALSGETFHVVQELGEEQLLRKSYDLAFSPIFDSNQQTILTAIVASDHSLQRVSERRFGAILDAMPDATIIMRSDGVIDLTNVHAEQLFGYSRRDMQGARIEMLIPERFRVQHIAHRNRFSYKPAARPMGSGKDGLLGLRQDGSEFPVEISLSPVDIDRVSMVVATVRDMTLRQHAQDELRKLSTELEKRVIERTLELEQANRNNRATFEQAAVGIAHVAPDGRWLQVNQKLCEILGYGKDEILKLSFQDVTYPDDLTADLRHVSDLLSGAISSYEMEKRYIAKSGEIVWGNLNVSLVRDSHGTPLYFISIVQDINARKSAEQALQESKQSLELAIEATGLGMFDYAPVSGALNWTAETKRHFGLSPGAEVNYSIFLAGIHPKDRERIDESVQQALRDNTGGRYHAELRTIGIEDKKMRWLEARGKVLFDTAGKAVRFIGSTIDITYKKETEERIRQLALHDPLTGLPNRGLLFEYTEHVFARTKRSGRHSGVLFVDLDRFKPINDHHGHVAGDEVLREVADRIKKCTRAEDIVFRLGGDEFMVLLPEIENDTNAAEVARHMTHCLNKPYRVGRLELTLSASVGISIYPTDGEDVDTLINHADAAMYLAKQQGRNNVQFYSKELAKATQLQSLIEERIRNALNQQDFRLYYQPVIDTMHSRVIYVEALLRWQHEDVGPDRFVPIAESTGQINRIGDWVLEEACRQHKAWICNGLPSIPIAINVSTVQFRQKDFIERLTNTIQGCQIGMSAVQIEITETALMDNIEHTIDALARLRSMGIKIALDDFGTGYSSLNYLSRLPIHKIKVDKSFVQRIETDTSSRAITEAVIALGRTLNLEIVAEGIETADVLHYLRRHGCGQAQGYYVARPLPAASFETWYRKYACHA